MTCDPNGSYARTWCPELAAVPDDFIHKPCKCPASMLCRTDLEERSLSLQDMKLGFVVNTDRQFLLPVITRMEFKHQSDDPDPDAASNPHVSRDHSLHEPDRLHDQRDERGEGETGETRER
ncbi:cryptochrome-1-like [Oncorhynchus kisutch]|uniref:cryptochrome-1-like n=1 Tax=Oncorhynchus kisutch TaxID=8019 RepID=UPI0012DE6770|nr:cryptochrome-1-like [Oncorhynchus kisutch]XP_031657860.1 cryptochrome-1-like [Oncorhynchus kisutch]